LSTKEPIRSYFLTSSERFAILNPNRRVGKTSAEIYNKVTRSLHCVFYIQLIREKSKRFSPHNNRITTNADLSSEIQVRSYLSISFKSNICSFVRNSSDIKMAISEGNIIQLQHNIAISERCFFLSRYKRRFHNKGENETEP